MNDDFNNVTKGYWSFGRGRRMCSGYNVGETNIWIVVARLLYYFDVEELPSQPIDSFTTNWGEHWFAPFAVNITPRSAAHAELIERDASRLWRWNIDPVRNPP